MKQDSCCPNHGPAGGAGPEFYPEPCPETVDFTVEGCQDFAVAQVPPIRLTSLGRIVQLDVTVRAVCPGKRIAVSVILTERDQAGNQHPRGVKHFVVPPQGGEGCRDVTLRCIRFSVPEALDPAGAADSICSPRTFQAQAIANYIDTDYKPCCAGTKDPDEEPYPFALRGTPDCGTGIS